MIRFKDIYLTSFFFGWIAVAILLFIAGYAYPSLEFIATVVLASLFGLTALDLLLIFSSKHPVELHRTVQKRLNLGDANEVKLTVKNLGIQPLSLRIIEGYPVEMQERSAVFKVRLTAEQTKELSYTFTPKSRGEVQFGPVLVMIRSLLYLVSRRYDVSIPETVRVYPSVLQMKRFELIVFHQQKTSSGIKKIRKLGNTSEFEQIKNYVQGDEPKKINWKATSRKSELMVNQYQEEKSQHVYFIIDKSRNMQMEYQRLSMLDHAINASLVLANIALKKGDKPGLITFSNKIGSILPAERSATQLRRIIETLFNQQTLYKESDYDLLYQGVRNTAKTRSLLLLFTNFETEFAMRRAIPMLRRLNQHHLLVVVFFENSGLQKLAFEQARNVYDVYRSTVAERMISTKARIASELQRNGIQTVLTEPEHVSVNAINKYLELKARGMI